MYSTHNSWKHSLSKNVPRYLEMFIVSSGFIAPLMYMSAISGCAVTGQSERKPENLVIAL